MNTVKIKDETELVNFLNNNPNGVISFELEGCPACKELEKQFAGKELNGKRAVVIAQEAPDLVKKFGYTAFPSSIVVRECEIVDEITGVKPGVADEITKKLEGASNSCKIV